jgi:hypothetical protein
MNQMVRTLLVKDRFVTVEIDESMIDGHVRMRSVYTTAVYDIGLVIDALLQSRAGPEVTLEKYVCNSDTFEKFKDHFIEFVPAP